MYIVNKMGEELVNRVYIAIKMGGIGLLNMVYIVIKWGRDWSSEKWRRGWSSE